MNRLGTRLLGIALFALLHQIALAGPAPIPAGPKGGRLLEKTQPLAEFVLEKDRTIRIHFYDQAMKPVPAGEQVVVVTADSKPARTKIEFEKKGDALVSKVAVPEGEAIPLVVQLKQSTGARPMNFRFKLETYVCGGCSRQEYACTCGH